VDGESIANLVNELEYSLEIRIYLGQFNNPFSLLRRFEVTIRNDRNPFSTGSYARVV
jgi:hypothetical protein